MRQPGRSTQSEARVVSTQKLPRVLDSRREMPRTSAMAKRDADGRGEEVVPGEGEHLGEIAHGGLGDVGLPVGVGGEGGSGVEGEIGGDVGEVLRVEWERMLDAFDRVGGEQAHEAEEEHDDGVFGPAHLVGLVDAGEAVDELLDGAEDAVGEGALALEDAGHVDAERLRADEDEREEEEDLKPAVRSHGECYLWGAKYFACLLLLKLFRTQERVDEVDEESDGDGGEEKGFEHHLVSCDPRRAHPVVYAMERMKKRRLAAMHPMSHMVNAFLLRAAATRGLASGR